MEYVRTAHNRTVYASPPYGRARATVLLGHSDTLHSHAKPPPHFASLGLATQALIRAGKTSYTAGTLCDIFLPQICRGRRRPWRLKLFDNGYRHLLTKILKNVILI
jgi:hypothetical protein